MIIDDAIFKQYLTPLIKAGLDTASNTKFFYDLLNSHQASQFILENDLDIPQFRFLREILDNQELTRCPDCGHFNDNIECPIIRCEICDYEWKVETESADTVCSECIAFRTQHCKKQPQGDNNGTNQT